VTFLLCACSQHANVSSPPLIDPVGTSGSGGGSGSGSSGSGFDGSPNIPTPPASAYQVESIQNLPNWNSATGAISTCANGVASSTCNPPNANYNPTVEHPPDPAPLAGSGNISGEFELLNSPAWADVIWTKNLLTNANASNFIWDLYLYVNSTNYSGSELDLVTTANGQEFMLGSVCNRPGNSWDTWNTATQQWTHNTNIPCNTLLTANTWHHITFYSTADTSNNSYEYHVIRIDNVDYVLNQTQYAAATAWPNALVGVQVQLDTNASGAGVNEYLESAQLYAW